MTPVHSPRRVGRSAKAALPRLLILAALIAGCDGADRPVVSEPAPSAGYGYLAWLPYKALSAGHAHTCALKLDGKAWCWGAGNLGQLGNGANTDSNVPVAVSTNLTFTAVSAGTGHTCALTVAGKVWCWGDNMHGQLGDGTNNNSNTPVQVLATVSFTVLSEGFGSQSCALTQSGRAWCWGTNHKGQLGDNTTTSRNTPVPVSGNVSFDTLTAAGWHTCALSPTGAAHCWGWNGFGQLGDGTVGDSSSVPVAVNSKLTFSTISAALEHVCALEKAGQAWCWGWNKYGQLGTGTNNSSSIPVAVATLLPFSAVSAGDRHSCALDLNGTAHCWGQNHLGQLGDGTNFDSNVPVAVSTALTFKVLTAGGAAGILTHTCAIAASGTAHCWGDNSRGQLGDGTNASSNVPVTVVF